jgi:3-dehydroquinate dehydratase
MRRKGVATVVLFSCQNFILLQEIDFPSVTVCNLNQFRMKGIKNLSEIDEIIELYLHVNRSKSDGSKFENSVEKQTKAFKNEFNADEDDDIDDVDISLDEDVVVDELIAIAASQYTQEELMKVGHQFEDMILSCSWKGFDCLTG